MNWNAGWTRQSKSGISFEPPAPVIREKCKVVRSRQGVSVLMFIGIVVCFGFVGSAAALVLTHRHLARQQAQQREKEQWEKEQREKEQRQQEQREKEQARRRREQQEETRRQQESGNERKAKSNGAKAQDWWVVLGTAPNATLETAKQAYRSKIKQYHPDRVEGLGAEFIQLASQKSKELNAALNEAKRHART
jgi:DnaJ-domain-containing protein 1